ncbi:hypothetical protein [Mycoplasma bradburyae]|uniref:hypothetical protein n=1 Tax=Mycoplasma bradburyae TaxID=2963128 RepID=UPI0020CBB75C|nr:hypothetical protein [Mycoplasma bradburyae]UTS70548.1 hypothetical protein NMG77_02225 [Mycoplasma bradburyae]
MKNKKILNIASLLGIFSVVSLSMTSCNGLKPSNSQMNNEKSTNRDELNNGLNPITPDNSGVSVDEMDNSVVNKLKTELSQLITNKNSIVSMYADYAKIKKELENAYTNAETINNNNGSNKEQLENAKDNLESAINKARTDKNEFDDKNQSLVSAYNNLKNIVKSKNTNLDQFESAKYKGIKDKLNILYENAETILNNTLQPERDLQIDTITSKKIEIDTAISNISTWKTNADMFSNYLMYKITQEKFQGTFTKTGTQSANYSFVGFSNDEQHDFKFAKRVVKENVASASLSNSDQLTDVSWIYDLTGTDAKYEFNFEYFGPSNAFLYFPYKLAKSSDINNLSLKYKLNTSQTQEITLENPEVKSIKIAKVRLNNLIFGQNTISFNTDNNKVTPMIGNMYITSSEDSENNIYNNIFGNEISNTNQNSITVNFLKGYGLANKHDTIIRRYNATLDDRGSAQQHFVLGFLGNNGTTNPESNESYYSFYVNAPQKGNYDISGIFSSGETNNNNIRGIILWRDSYNNDKKARFDRLISFNSWDKLKTFTKTDKASGFSGSLELEKGLNKIIVSGNMSAKPAPNLGNLTFTLTTIDSRSM